METLFTNLESVVSFLLDHAPFFGVMLILFVAGHRMGKQVFTRARAYELRGRTAKDLWRQRLMFWGRETAHLHSTLTGAFIGLLWVDPENLGWGVADSVGYFASAGALAELLRACVKAWAKEKGIVLTLPGESERPPAPEAPCLLDSVPPPDLSDDDGLMDAPTTPRGSNAAESR